MPLAMKAQINKEESQSFPNTNLDRLGKTRGYLQLRSFTVFTLHNLYLGKLGFLRSFYNEILRVARIG